MYLPCSDSGSVLLERTVPDSVTTWITDVFALSDSAAFGVSESPGRLVAFKPFFVSLNIPSSVVRGEVIVVLATVFNYYHEDLKVGLFCLHLLETFVGAIICRW